MDSEYLISVIVPAFNAEKYIEACLESILRQSYSNIEILLIDDGSTDNTLKICQKIQSTDSRLLIFNQKNSGASIARNFGIEQSSGKFIMFVDGDDVIEPKAIEILFKRLIEDKADIAEGSSYSFIEPDKKKPSIFTKRCPKKRVLQSEIALEHIFHFRMNTAVWAKLYRRGIITDDIRFPNGQTFNEDLNFLFKLYKKGLRISLTKELIYGYRMNPQSVTHKFTEKKFELLSNAEFMREEISPKNKRLLKALGIYVNVLIANLFISMRNSSAKNRFPNEFKRLKYHLRRNCLAYIFGRHYTLKDRAKMLCAFL